MSLCLPLLIALTLLGCNGRPSPKAQPAPGPDAGVPHTNAAATARPLTPSRRDAAPARSEPMKALETRLDLTLRPGESRAIEALDLTVTLLGAERLRLRDGQGRTAHADTASLRIERAGQPDRTLDFGPGGRAHVVDGHTFAIFGGTVLSVFPPGMPAIP